METKEQTHGDRQPTRTCRQEDDERITKCECECCSCVCACVCVCLGGVCISICSLFVYVRVSASVRL